MSKKQFYMRIYFCCVTSLLLIASVGSFIDIKSQAQTKAITFGLSNLRNTNFNLKESQQYFFDYINYLTKSDNPILIVERNASLSCQQSIYLILSNYFNNIKKDNPNILIDIVPMIFDTPSSQRFNIELLKKYNMVNVIQNTIDNTKINFSFTNNNDMSQNLDINNNIDLIRQSSKDGINFVINDLDFYRFISAKQSFNQDDTIFKIIKNANTICLTCDGNAQINEIVPFFEKFLNSNQFKKYDDQSTMKLINDIESGYRDSFNLNDLINMMLIRASVDNKFNFIHMLNFDSSYINNMSINNAPISDELKYNVSSFSFNPEDYAKNCLNNNQYFEQYIKLFSALFYLMDEEGNDSIFISNGNLIDNNKPMMMFVGSSLFRPFSKESDKYDPNMISRLEVFPNLRKAVQKTFDMFLEKFPVDKYNIIFKHHPAFNKEEAIGLTKIYTSNKINEPIIINPRIPLEALVASEYAKLFTHQTSFLFKEKDNYDTAFSLFGLQATTTTIATTRLFFESTFNLTPRQTAQKISLQNFPIPSLYDLVLLENEDPTQNNKFNKNIKTVRNIYKYWNYSQAFNKKNEIDHDRFFYDNIAIAPTINLDPNWLIYIKFFAPIGSVILFAVFICVIWLIIKLNRKKKMQN